MEVLGVLDPLDGEVAFTAVPRTAAIDGGDGLRCGDSAEGKGMATLPALYGAGRAEWGEECFPPLPRSVAFEGDVDGAIFERQVGFDNEASVIQFNGLVYVLVEQRLGRRGEVTESFCRQLAQAVGLTAGRVQSDIILTGSKGAAITTSQSPATVGLRLPFQLTNDMRKWRDLQFRTRSEIGLPETEAIGLCELALPGGVQDSETGKDRWPLECSSEAYAGDVDQVQAILSRLLVFVWPMPVQREDDVARMEVGVADSGLMDVGDEPGELDKQFASDRLSLPWRQQG